MLIGMQLDSAHCLIIRKNKRDAEIGEADVTLINNCLSEGNIYSGKNRQLS
ncbi:hypothetical protein DFLDMN_004179 [Cupriavidus sp. H19C3]